MPASKLSLLIVTLQGKNVSFTQRATHEKLFWNIVALCLEVVSNLIPPCEKRVLSSISSPNVWRGNKIMENLHVAKLFTKFVLIFLRIE